MNKIALLFLTIDNHNQPKIWNKFLSNNKYFNIYCHPKYPENVTDNFLKNNIISKISDTSWGHFVIAYYNLLKAAIKDKNNIKFVFISESCIPIKPPKDIYRELLKNNNSFYNLKKLDNFSYTKRYKPYKNKLNKYNINTTNFIKHSGWFCLNRNDTKILINDKDKIKLFNSIEAGDEHILSILNSYNIKLEQKLITFTLWNNKKYEDYKKERQNLWKIYDSIDNSLEKNKMIKIIKKHKEKFIYNISHPKTYSNISKLDIENWYKNKALFVRKISKDVNPDLILRII